MDLLSVVRISYFFVILINFHRPSDIGSTSLATQQQCIRRNYIVDNLQLAAAAYTFVAARNFMCRISVPMYLFLLQITHYRALYTRQYTGTFFLILN